MATVLKLLATVVPCNLKILLIHLRNNRMNETNTKYESGILS